MEWKYSRQPERVLSSRRGLGALPRQDRLCWRWEYFIEFAGKYFTEENISDSGRGQAGGLQLFIFLYLAGQQRHQSRLRDWQLVAHISSLMLGFGCLEQFHSNICVYVNYKRFPGIVFRRNNLTVISVAQHKYETSIIFADYDIFFISKENNNI